MDNLKPITEKPASLGAPIREVFSSFHRTCPSCGNARGYSSRPKGKYESFVLPLFFRRPFRCKACHVRFYSFDLSWASVKRVLLALVLMAVLVYGFWDLIAGFIALNIRFDLF